MKFSWNFNYVLHPTTFSFLSSIFFVTFRFNFLGFIIAFLCSIFFSAPSLFSLIKRIHPHYLPLNYHSPLPSTHPFSFTQNSRRLSIQLSLSVSLSLSYRKWQWQQTVCLSLPRPFTWSFLFAIGQSFLRFDASISTLGFILFWFFTIWEGTYSRSCFVSWQKLKPMSFFLKRRER